MDQEYIRTIIDEMVEQGFKEHEAPKSQAMARSDFEAALKKVFIGYFTAEYIESYFAIPEDFWNFLEVLKGGLNRNDWEYIYAKSGVIVGSEDNMSYAGYDLKWRFEKGETPLAGDLMFIRIGDWSDKHDYLLCSDKSPRAVDRYGKVYDAYDDSPWQLDNNYYDEWDDFASFLQGYYNAGQDSDDFL